LLDNPERLAAMVHASGAESTDLQHPEDVDELCGRCIHASEAWKVAADKLWYANHEPEQEDEAINQ